MPKLTEEGRSRVAEIAARHQFSADAAASLLDALLAGHGSQAQFNHPEFGGMGQWSRGGMIMIGDMFNNTLKARVDALCTELSGLVDPGQGVVQDGSTWWPAELGAPSSVGAQNDLRYAYFPASRRLALDVGGRISVMDTGEHLISGVSQQQGSDQAITFTSQFGLVRVADLPVVVPAGNADPEEKRPEVEPNTQAPLPPRDSGHPDHPQPASEGDVFAKLEGLAELRRKDILTETEYTAKKAELLARL